jgi:SAM-dependent methyltransferase
MRDEWRRIVHNYWNREPDDPNTSGMAGMGTPHAIELPYRIHGELETLRKRLPAKPFSMLELGCGGGRWAFGLSKQLTRYVGVDMSKPQIEIATRRARKNNLQHLRFILQSIDEYDPGADKFDVVYFGGVILYFHDEAVQTLLRRYLPVLRPGGLLVNRDTLIVGREAYIRKDPDYMAVYRTREELIALFAQNGLRCIGDEQSYTFLRTAALWSSPELCAFAGWGLKHMPAATCALMQAFSADISSKTDAYCHEGDKTYDHRFFYFAAD